MKRFTFSRESKETLRYKLEKFAEQGCKQLKMMFSVYMNTPSLSPQTAAGDNFDALCARVDAAIYKAKQTGKNKVVRG